MRDRRWPLIRMGIIATDETMVTRYAALSRAQAVGVVALLLTLMGWLMVGATIHAPPSPTPQTDAAKKKAPDTDDKLYKAIVARMQAGQGYYQVTGAELRGRGYPVRPVFNWRQPTNAWLLSHLPRPEWGLVLLVLAGAGVVLLTILWMRESQLRTRAQLTTAFVALTMASCFKTDYVYMHELWAGFFIALSIGFFALDYWQAGVAAALVALSFREFALLPCGVGLLLALHRRRWAEVAAWLAGLAIYVGLMAWHIVVVTRHFQPDDPVRSWVTLGGSAFILTTSRWNTLFVLFPGWAVAVVLPFVLLGLAGWREPAVNRVALIVFGYLLVFSFIGHTFNGYWGLLYGPLLPFGLIAAPEAIRDLWRALTRAHVRDVVR